MVLGLVKINRMKKTPRVDESIYSMIKDTRKDEKDYRGTMKH